MFEVSILFSSQSHEGRLRMAKLAPPFRARPIDRHRGSADVGDLGRKSHGLVLERRDRKSAAEALAAKSKGRPLPSSPAPAALSGSAQAPRKTSSHVLRTANAPRSAQSPARRCASRDSERASVLRESYRESRRAVSVSA